MRWRPSPQRERARLARDRDEKAPGRVQQPLALPVVGADGLRVGAVGALLSAAHGRPEVPIAEPAKKPSYNGDRRLGHAAALPLRKTAHALPRSSAAPPATAGRRPTAWTASPPLSTR